MHRHSQDVSESLIPGNARDERAIFAGEYTLMVLFIFTFPYNWIKI